ncbi:MAG TPA: hypothetical protein VGF28_17910 [Thermoanaerobaculia bacterium]
MIISCSLFVALAAAGEDCSVMKWSAPLRKDNVVLSIGSGLTMTTGTSLLNAGADYWRDGCTEEGTGFADICVNCSAQSSFPVRINFVDAASPTGRCGETQYSGAGGTTPPTSATVTLWKTAGGYSCLPYADPLAHELGHVLGLRDPMNAGQCNGSIMGARAVGGVRQVTSADCSEVEIAWLISSETNPEPAPIDPGSPILLDLGHDSYRLTSVSHGVRFDLRNEGVAVTTAWTRANTEVAFLAFDRNGNGRIDSGAELFGNFTPLATGDVAANGYEALREFDDTQDGVVNAADAGWRLLLLWTDRDHDGSSSDAELRPIAESNVTALETGYLPVGRKDQWGNEFRYLSHFSLQGSAGDSRRAYYDVFFAIE